MATNDDIKAFLDTAPDELNDWVDEQRRALDAPRPPVSATTAQRKPKNKVNLVLAALLAAAVVIIVQQMGTGAPVAEKSPQANPHGQAAPEVKSSYAPVDQAKVDALKKKVDAAPNDLAARKGLGELYLAAGLFQDAQVQFDAIVAKDPKNFDGLLSSGVTAFNTGKYDKAEQRWKAAAGVSPTRPHSWYNLGFLYMAKTPPDKNAAITAWNKVIELDPTSELAKTAKTHVERIGKK